MFLGGLAACGARAPMTARPVTPHADDHGLSKIGPCLDAAEADRTRVHVPPSLIGRLVELDHEAIVVQHESSGARIWVRISDGTVLCTVQGGFVQRTELAVGQHVAVWLPEGPQDLGAIAVMLASKAPGDGWPETAR